MDLTNRHRLLKLPGSLGIGLLSLALADAPVVADPSREGVTREGFHRPGVFGKTLAESGHFTILLPSGQSAADSVLMIEATSGPSQGGCSGNTWDYAISNGRLDSDAVGSWASSGVLYDPDGNRVTFHGYSKVGVETTRLIADTTYPLADFIGSGGAAALPNLAIANHNLYFRSTSSSGAAFAQGSRTTSLQFTQQIRASARGPLSTLFCDITFDVRIEDGGLVKEVGAARPAHWETLGTTSYLTDSDSGSAATDAMVVLTGAAWDDTRSIASGLWNGESATELTLARGESWPVNEYYPTSQRLVTAFNACSAFHRIKEDQNGAGGMLRLW